MLVSEDKERNISSSIYFFHACIDSACLLNYSHHENHQFYYYYSTTGQFDEAYGIDLKPNTSFCKTTKRNVGLYKYMSGPHNFVVCIFVYIFL